MDKYFEAVYKQRSQESGRSRNVIVLASPFDTPQTRSKFIDLVAEDNSHGIFPHPTEAQYGLDVIQQYLMPGFQVSDPISQKQANTIFVHELLMKFSRKYRTHYKRAIREYK